MKTATNPETGERFVLEGNQWVPLKTASNSETGEQFGLVGGEWVALKQPGPVEPPKEYEQSFGPVADGLIEGISTVGSSVVGGLAGFAGGMYDAVTGEDYETARATQDRIAESLTYQPRSEAGQNAMQGLGSLLDNPVFNYLGETGESWGQGANDYLLDTPLSSAAPALGMLASVGPDVAAGAATGAVGNGILRTGRALNNARIDSGMRNRVAPSILGDDRSVGASQTELARQNAATAQDLQTPIQLTQGQATRNAAQMSDEYNMVRTDGEGVAEPLAALQRQQQALLHQNLEQVADSLDRSEPINLNSDEELGRSIKNTLQRRKDEAKAKTGRLYDMAEEQGALDEAISVGSLDGAFAELNRRNFDLHEPEKMRMLAELAERTGVSGGQPATIRQVEDFRQNINRVLDDPTSKNQSQMAGVLKTPVDEALNKAPDSAEAYKRARASYARDKRETEGNALVTQIMGNKKRTDSPSIADEKVYQTIITAPISDAKKMLRSLAKTDGGVNMIHNIGQRRMMDLIETATKTDGSFNSAQFAKEIRKLDQSGRLEALYGPARAEELRNIAEVGKSINTLPYGHSANVSQSGNTMIKRVADVIGRGPILGPLARKAGNKYNDWAQEYETQKKVEKALDIEGILSYKD